MKKIIAIFFTVILVFTGCQKHSEKEEAFSKDFYVGVIETTSQKEKSFILYLDENMETVCTQTLPYGMVGDTFTSVTVKDGFLYTTAQGIDKKRDEGLILSVNLENGIISKDSHGLVGPSAHAESDKYLFVCNNLNFVSNIVRIDKESKKTKKAEFSVHNITSIEMYNNNIIAFAETYENNGELSSSIFILDEELNVVKNIDISKDGGDVYQTLVLDGKMYFGMMTDQKNNPNNRLGILDLDNYQISTIELEETNPFDIVFRENKLYISHYSFNEEDGKVTVLNLQNGEQEILMFSHPVKQIELKDDKLYIPVENSIYTYKWNNDDLECIGNHEISVPSDTKYYFGGLFFKE